MTKDEHKEIERTKKLSIIEGNFSVLQTGFGTNNIVPYAIALGGNNPHLNTFVGFLSSFPSLLGNVSQIFTYKLLEKYFQIKKEHLFHKNYSISLSKLSLYNRKIDMLYSEALLCFSLYYLIDFLTYKITFYSISMRYSS